MHNSLDARPSRFISRPSLQLHISWSIMCNESRTHVSSAWGGVTYIWMISGYLAGYKCMLCTLACVRRRQICICRYMFMISEESAGRCHTCTSYEESTAVNHEQCHIYIQLYACLPVWRPQNTISIAILGVWSFQIEPSSLDPSLVRMLGAWRLRACN